MSFRPADETTFIHQPLNIQKSCWVEGDYITDAFKEFSQIKQKFLAYDKSQNLVFLADSDFSLQMTQDQYPDLKFHNTSEF